jgi:hypothetical protein
MSLLFQIESCLRITRLPASRFGRDAVKDPRIVHDLRRGRQPGARMEKRLQSYIRTLLDQAGARNARDAGIIGGVAEPVTSFRGEAGQ